MPTITGPWVADLIRTHQAALAEAATDAARAEVAQPDALPGDDLQPLFAQAYQGLAEAFAASDLAPLRAHLHALFAERRLTEAESVALLAALALLPRPVEPLIAGQAALDPAHAVAGLHMLELFTEQLQRLLHDLAPRQFPLPPPSENGVVDLAEPGLDPALAARVRVVATWMAGELRSALQGRSITQQRLVVLIERAQQPGAPLGDALGQVFAVELLAALALPAQTELPTPTVPTVRRHTVL